MAISLEELVKATDAEEVGGNIIIGIMATRKFVGKIEGGVFSLNEAGQEIVARSQYRGTIKRRLQLAQTISLNPIYPGQEVFSDKEPDQPCGLVVLAAKSPSNSDCWILQVECKLEAMNTLMTLENLNGSPLELLPLPYSLPTL